MAWGPPKVMKNAFNPVAALYGSVALPFVIPSVPGFPVRCTRESSVCGFLQGKPHEDCDVTDLDRKSGAAEGSAVLRTIPGNVFRQRDRGPAAQTR
jgi:hypothetical protein